MNYLSVCSGIEAASVAWHPLGWRAAWLAEIEAFPCAVLRHHYPDVPNLGDITNFKGWPDAVIDVLVGGTPCQSFSVAGLRKGLADPRGNLALTFLAIADRYRPRWILWENVPGVLSSDDGRDFGAFLGGLGQCGYGWAYRVLDAQYFGVPQRRRRVFVVGCFGDWRSAAAVLFERHSLQGNPAPRREAGKGIAPTIASRPSGGGGPGTDFETVNFVTHSLRADGFDVSEDGAGRGTPIIAFAQNQLGEVRGGEVVNTLNTNSNASGRNTAMIAFNARQDPINGDVSQPIDTDGHTVGVAMGASSVRRLTPRECERLQGFPDDYTLTPYRGKPAADGPRYKALGNSMAVPCMAWIGRRIDLVNRFQDQALAEVA